MANTVKEIEPEYKGKGIFEPASNMKELLYDIIAKEGPIDRAGLVRQTGIPRTTIYDSLVKLMLTERIKRSVEKPRRRGRPRVFFEIQVK